MATLSIEPQVFDPKVTADLFQQAMAQITARQLSVADLIATAAKLQSMGNRQAASDLYKTWIAFNAESPFLYAAYFNYAVGLCEMGDRTAGINALRESLRLKPDFHAAYINLGRALEDAGQIGEAVKQWLALNDQLSVIKGEVIAHKLTALQQTGRVLEGAFKDNAAEDALRQSLDINSRQTEVVQHWIALRQRQCKWPVIEPWDRASRKDLLNGISSLSLANLADDPMFQLAKAYQYAKRAIGMPKPMRAHGAVPQGRRDPAKLRIGYVSSDLREHAVGFAMTDVIEQHDREKFEIFAYYCGIKRIDPIQHRIMKSADRWTEINGMTDDQAAAKIAEDGVDILIDLNGYTKDARTKVFALRPAPINVNWFGFPGTMGTPYHHYIIADPYVIPPESEIYYSEKVMRLPCYQPNDRKRTVSQRRPTRAEVGLPDNAFVFCSLNGMQKMTPRAFKRWMTILQRVPDSVLWILSGTEGVDDRVRQHAVNHGIAGERIIFAGKMPNPDHLARYPLADLFLDSFPYGAHTTASDSLWMNVPILTLPGRTFPSRVCADLVSAAGAPELVCSSSDQFVARAVELATDRAKLDAIKTKLAAGRDHSLLFDTPQLVRNLEDLYRQMWGDLVRGALPLPDLRNLDIYHEIGVDLDLENIEALGNDEYVALYRDKLAEWHAAYPIEADARLWREEAPVASNVTRLASNKRR